MIIVSRVILLLFVATIGGLIGGCRPRHNFEEQLNNCTAQLHRIDKEFNNFKACTDMMSKRCMTLDTDAARAECLISNRYACYTDK